MKNKTSDWDLSPLFTSYTSWKKALSQELSLKYELLFGAFHSKQQFTPKELRKLLDLYFERDRNIKKIYTWAHLFHDQNTANAQGREAYSSALFCMQRFKEATSWIEPSILQHSEKTLEQFTHDTCLAEYSIFLSNLRRIRPHTLSSELEALMALSGKDAFTAYKTFSALNDADLVFPSAKDTKGKEHSVTHGSFQQLIRSNDRTLRENAYRSLHGTYRSFKNSFSELLSGQMNRHAFDAQARKYHSCLEASLFPKDIPLKVYHTLIDTVRSNIAPLHRYMKLRKKLLNVPVLKPWDLYAPLIQKHKEPSYSYEEAVELVLHACKPLGKEYVFQLQKGLTHDRWVDVLEKKSKRSGAYSSGCYDSYPYILLNFKGTLRDVYTLAHEAGHSMHSFLSRKNQPYHQSEYEIFVAEVASTLNEELLTEYLSSQKIDQRFLLNEQLEDIRATFFRQTMFAEFELFVHEEAEKGTPLTAEFLKNKYLELNKAYYGNELDCTDELAIEWARIPHFYYNFYVYQYATGISAAHAIKEAIDSQGPKATKKYLHFLSSGSSKYPILLLKEAGVDMTSKEPFLQLIQKFDSLLALLSSGC